MYENSHEFFKVYNGRFKFCLTTEKPDTHELEKAGVENFAYAYHEPNKEFEFCKIQRKHFHLVYESLSLENSKFQPENLHSIECIITCFKFLINPLYGILVVGSILRKVETAVNFISINNPRLFLHKRYIKTIPELRNSDVYTPLLHDTNAGGGIVSNVTIARFCNLIQSEHASCLFNLMDILQHGQGVYKMESHRFSWNFVLKKM